MKAALLLFAIVSCLTAADPTGDWTGSLDAGGTKLRLVLHIQRSAAGQLTATMDSPDQGSTGMPASSATLERNELKLAWESIKGAYNAKISEDNKTLAGTWSQSGTSVPLTMTRGAAPESAAPSASDTSAAPLLGIWEGALDAGAVRLRLRFTLRKDEKSGGIAGALDSVDQNAMGIPMTSITLKESGFRFDVPGVGASYTGTVNPARDAIQGTWKQGAELPLNWKKVDKPTALNRPQHPMPPFPYHEEDVKFSNAKAPGVELAGTLTRPNGDGPFPAVVLISGSGPQDRDETILGHKPFLVLADALTRKGIAVLRYDDRGFGKSTGKHAEATSADFATDAEAAVAFLKKRPDVDAKRIGLLGHSEGGLIAPMVAARSTDIAFLVLIAAPGEPASELLQRQARALMSAAGRPEEEIAKTTAAQKEAFRVLATEHDDAAARTKLMSLVLSTGPATGAEAASVNMMLSPWFRYFINYDPVATLAKIKIPVLAVNGSLDLQVDPKVNLAGIRSALAKAENTQSKIVELPGLNHLLQKAQTGTVAEYGVLEETINPAALQTITEWIVSATRQ